MIQVEGSAAPSSESCIEVPSVKDIPEEDGDGEEKSDGKVSTDLNGSASPRASENPPELSNGSVSKEEETKAEEQGKEEVPLKAETATESALATEEKDKGEDIQTMVEEQPPSNQEVLEEALPPPPSEEIPSGATEMSPESPPGELPDFPPPPHNDSGFQSPTSEKAEEEGPSTVVPQPVEEHPEVMEKSVAAAPEAETTTSDSAREQ